MHALFFTPSHILAPILLFFSIVKGLEALSCVICDSTSDENCALLPVLVPRQDCSKWCKERGGFIPQTMRQKGVTGTVHKYPAQSCPYSGQFSTCRKIMQTISADASATSSRVIRACGFIGNSTNQPTSTYKSNPNSKIEVHNCFADNCNSAPSGFHSKMCTTATFLIVWIIFLVFCEPAYSAFLM